MALAPLPPDLPGHDLQLPEALLVARGASKDLSLPLQARDAAPSVYLFHA